MTWLLAIGAIAIVSTCAFGVWMFFKGANTERAKEEYMWDDLQNKLSDKYTFRFFGDCGAPRSLEKEFKPYNFSCNAMMGVVKGDAATDVLDFSLSKNREPDTPRIHGLIFQIMKHMLKEDVIDKSSTISFDSKDGDYQLVECPNKNYVYLLIVDEGYYPVVFDSIAWRTPCDTDVSVQQNLDLVHKYMDIFCITSKEANPCV